MVDAMELAKAADRRWRGLEVALAAHDEMDEQRIPCRADGCHNTILPATADRTGGICRPCEQRVAREEREAYVRANRREVDPFQGVTDSVELVKLLVRPAVRDELVREKPFSGEVDTLFLSLTPAQRDEVIKLTVSYWVNGRSSEAEQLAFCLAAFTSADLTEIHNEWLERGALVPGILFRGAGPGTVQRILAHVPSETLRLNHALIALAWIGDAFVCDLFASWRSRPPMWANRLYVPPHTYALQAGWELDRQGLRRELYSSQAFALVPATSPGEPSPVEVIEPATGHCEWCAGPLTMLLRIDVRDSRLSAQTLPESVVTCAQCSCYGLLFMAVDASGTAHWHAQNNGSAYGPNEPATEWKPSRRLILGPSRGPLHAADQSLPVSFSQLGGAPGWIQDAEYPRCPECAYAMSCIGQIAREDVEGFAEGMFYAFWCAVCRVTATTYQQT